jgi:hypothetical protein
MAGIYFESIESRFTVLHPSNTCAEEMHSVAVRRDPLLGDTSIFNLAEELAVTLRAQDVFP